MTAKLSKLIDVNNKDNTMIQTDTLQFIEATLPDKPSMSSIKIHDIEIIFHDEVTNKKMLEIIQFIINYKE